MISAALFDFDGTLVDTTELIHQGLLRATREVLGRGIPREKLMANVGQPLLQQMKVIDPDSADELFDAYHRHHDALHDDLIQKFPGVEEALARLHSVGIKTAVVTSKRRPAVDMALNSFPGLATVTDHFLTMEDTTEHKPHPAPLLKGLELLGNVPREEAVYVGDSPHDVAAARAAGMTCIAVSWGAFSKEMLQAAEPDHLVPDLDSAVDLLLEMKTS